MAHYAKVEGGVVTQVIVADNKEWCESNLGGTWIQTSYNTHGGVNSRQGGEALHKNYAGIGYTYNPVADVFISPQPYAYWSLDDNFDWQPPTPRPEGLNWRWDEENLLWQQLES